MTEPYDSQGNEEALALALRLGLEECERLRSECQALQDRVAYHDKLLWDAQKNLVKG